MNSAPIDPQGGPGLIHLAETAVMPTKPGARQSTANRLIAALDKDRFVLYRQLIKPIGSVADGSDFQEILIRFLEEEEKLLYPGSFFPILESYNLMSILDRWVVNRVIKWLLAKREARGNWNAPRCGINLSIDSISDADFPGFIKERLQTSMAPPGKLSFEVCEADAGAHAMALKRLIAELKPLGCGFALTGYNGEVVAAELLQALGIDFVKIDSHIVANGHPDGMSFAGEKSIRLACQATGIRTIGEFVERPETLEKLKELGVDYAQGYGIARPEPLT